MSSRSTKITHQELMEISAAVFNRKEIHSERNVVWLCSRKLLHDNSLNTCTCRADGEVMLIQIASLFEIQRCEKLNIPSTAWIPKHPMSKLQTVLTFPKKVIVFLDTYDVVVLKI